MTETEFGGFERRERQDGREPNAVPPDRRIGQYVPRMPVSSPNVPVSSPKRPERVDRIHGVLRP